MIELSGLPDRQQSSARDVNDVGQVIGTAFAGGNDIGHAVLWTDGLATDLGVLGIGPYSGGSGINANGDAVGYSYHNGPTLQDGTHVFLYTGASGMTDLTPTPEDNRAYATDINDPGQIAGYRGVYSHATRWIDAVAEDLGTLPG
jgi:probable HAF family extracellular repeat protein